LSFFLAKTKNIPPEYNAHDLDFQGQIPGAGLDEYLQRLEAEWGKVDRSFKDARHRQ
jgi:hypothetical protein